MAFPTQIEIISIQEKNKLNCYELLTNRTLISFEFFLEILCRRCFQIPISTQILKMLWICLDVWLVYLFINELNEIFDPWVFFYLCKTHVNFLKIIQAYLIFWHFGHFPDTVFLQIVDM